MAQEIEIVKGNQRGNITDSIRPILRADQLVLLQKEVENIYIHDVIYNYIGELVTETRKHPMIELGISPRGTVALAKMTKAIAYLNGRNYCVPKDVQEILKCGKASHSAECKSAAQPCEGTGDYRGDFERCTSSKPKGTMKERVG